MKVLLLFLALFNPDHEIAHFVWSNSSPLLDNVMELATQSANKEVLALGCAGLFFFGSKDLRRESVVLGTWGLLTALTVYSIKAIVNRPRPDGTRDRFNSSFPSGHTAATFFIATYMGRKHEKLKIPLILWAGLVGYSRVYLKRHWPSDVLFGAIIGISAGHLANKTERWIWDVLKFD